MRRLTHIEFSFKPPRNGWLPFRLSLGDCVIEDTASNVLNDPLAELIDAAMSPPSRVASIRICFWLEPAGYALDLLQADEPDLSVLRLSYDDSFVPPMRHSDMTIKQEALLESRLIRTALVSGLVAFGRSADTAALEKWFGLENAATHMSLLARLAPLRA